MMNVLLELRVGLVAMRSPIVAVKIEFDIARARRLLTEAEHGVPEIRTAFPVPETRMQHAQRSAVGRAEPLAQQALMKPNDLKQPFRWCLGFVVETKHDTTAAAPFGVATG